MIGGAASEDDPTGEPKNATRERVRVVINGHVQNVFFRASCEREAQRLGLDGWVKNLEDGSVEAVFEGRPPSVRAAVDWCRVGPRRARVDSVDVVVEAPRGERGFHVR
ncbi:MAG TPA: acylphosphatase [Acidimicrobiales bacterium]|nr:acylphosphatase [Acidimicrobiales bacterium]